MKKQEWKKQEWESDKRKIQAFKVVTRWFAIIAVIIIGILLLLQ